MFVNNYFMEILTGHERGVITYKLFVHNLLSCVTDANYHAFRYFFHPIRRGINT